jgi:hypothetical protein
MRFSVIVASSSLVRYDTNQPHLRKRAISFAFSIRKIHAMITETTLQVGQTGSPSLDFQFPEIIQCGATFQDIDLPCDYRIPLPSDIVVSFRYKCQFVNCQDSCDGSVSLMAANSRDSCQHIKIIWGCEI